MRRQLVPAAIKPPSAASYASYSSAAIPAFPGLKTSAGERLNTFPLICANKGIVEEFWLSAENARIIVLSRMSHEQPSSVPSAQTYE